MPDRAGTIRSTPEGKTKLAFVYHRPAQPGKKGKKAKPATDVQAPIHGWRVLSAELVDRAARATDPLAELDGTRVKGDLTGDGTATALHEGPAHSAPDSEQVAALSQRCPLVTAAPAEPPDPHAAERQRTRARAEAQRRREIAERDRMYRVEERSRRAKPKPAQAGRQQRERRPAPQAGPSFSTHGRSETAARDFHNPYAFIPAPPRENLTGTLGDAEPLGHDRYHPEGWSGRLTVCLRVLTPVLIPDHAVYEHTPDAAPEHGFYDVRTTPAGDPDLAPSALKGMLRTAFEAVTNSRLSVFSHTGPLTRRLAFAETADLTPVRVTISERGDLRIEEMNRVRLPYYANARRYPGGEQPRHGDAVTVTTRADGKAGPKVDTVDRLGREPGQTATEGWVVVTGRPEGGANKKHEAVFTRTGRLLKGAEDELADGWQAVIDSYVHARAQPGAIVTNGLHTHEGYRDLRRLARQQCGLLCYAKKMGATVRWLLPTRVARMPFATRPIDALPRSLRPARDRSQLSPADRVFGWAADAAPGAGGAHRGQITVKAPRCSATPDGGAIRSFRHAPIPLAILSAPKPQEALFYAARDEYGTAPSDGDGKALRTLALSESYGLRGRKVYPHQPRSADGFSLEQPAGEFRRAADRRDTQNRSVLGWVNPGTEFTIDIDIVNLNAAELGALIWLLRRPDGHAFAFGGGRPLGFGAVRVELVDARAQTGAETARAIRELTPQAAPTRAPRLHNDELAQLEEQFVTATRDLCGQTVSQPPAFIAAFDRALEGLPGDLPTHYPRLQRDPQPEGKNYEWFTSNANGGQHALPDTLDDIQGLPRNPS